MRDHAYIEKSASGLELSLTGDRLGAGEDNEDDTPKASLATKAIDELWTILISFCRVIEIFFQPFYPIEVTQDLHEDLMFLTQHLLFKRQEDGRIYECITVLMRVDS